MSRATSSTRRPQRTTRRSLSGRSAAQGAGWFGPCPLFDWGTKPGRPAGPPAIQVHLCTEDALAETQGFRWSAIAAHDRRERLRRSLDGGLVQTSVTDHEPPFL